MSESETRRIGKITLEEKTENGNQSRLPDVRVIVLLACVLLLLMLILFLLLFLRLSSKGPGDSFRYGEPAAEYALDSTSDSVCAAFGSRFAAVTDRSFLLADAAGQTLGSVQDSFQQPLLITGKPMAAVLESTT